ncbi:hypothetical protein ARMGADRAFT_447335 [Armillaria gallica]|uniref:Uncharacterized protein n=1 Tax=Armillaria gallica TaxID=47427 RepID=A0A2H3D9T1_ARMGA|nr:hypothetical protein ARMGADRAFT_447335 [Armillaria gallica]
MRLGSPPIHYELACRFRIDTTDHLKYTLIVYTSDIQNSTSINLSRHPGDTSTIAKCLQLRSRRPPLRAARRYFAPSFPAFHSRRFALSTHTKKAMLEWSKTSLPSKPTLPKPRNVYFTRRHLFLQYLHRPLSRDTSSRSPAVLN